MPHHADAACTKIVVSSRFRDDRIGIILPEETEIVEANERLRDSKNGEDFQIFLKYANSKIMNIRKLSILAIFRHFADFPEMQAEAVTCLLQLLEDRSGEIRTLVASKIGTACSKDAKGICVAAVANVLAQLICTAQGNELKFAYNSLSRIIADNKEALCAVHTAIEESASDKEQLMLIAFLDSQIEKHGKMEENERRRLITLLERMVRRCTQPQEITEILSRCSLNLFPTVEDKREFLSKVTPSLAPLIDITEPQAEAVVEMFVQSVVWSKWIGSTNAIAANFVRYVLDNCRHLNNLNRYQRLKMLRACAELTWRKDSFKYLPEHFSLRGYSLLFSQFLNVIPIGQNISEKTLIQDVDLLMIEAFLISLHNLMGGLEEFQTILDTRSEWGISVNRFLLLLKKFSAKVKSTLDELDNNHPDRAQTKMAGNAVVNIGVLLIDFMREPKPSRTRVVTPSWFKIYHFPAILNKNIQNAEEDDDDDEEHEEEEAKKIVQKLPVRKQRKLRNRTPPPNTHPLRQLPRKRRRSRLAMRSGKREKVEKVTLIF